MLEKYFDKICDIVYKNLDDNCKQCPIHKCVTHFKLLGCIEATDKYPKETLLAIQEYFHKENKTDLINPIISIE